MASYTNTGIKAVISQNKKYMITNMSVQHNNSYNQMSSLMGSQNRIGDTSVDVDITINIPDHSGLKLQSLEDLERFLGNSNVPDWCTDEMLVKALKENYPEEFL